MTRSGCRECIKLFFSPSQHPDTEICPAGVSQMQNLNSDSPTILAEIKRSSQERADSDSREHSLNINCNFEKPLYSLPKSCLLFLRTNIYRNNRRICWEQHEIFPAWYCGSSRNFLKAFLCVPPARDGVFTLQTASCSVSGKIHHPEATQEEFSAEPPNKEGNVSICVCLGEDPALDQRIIQGWQLEMPWNTHK